MPPLSRIPSPPCPRASVGTWPGAGHPAFKDETCVLVTCALASSSMGQPQRPRKPLHGLCPGRRPDETD